MRHDTISTKLGERASTSAWRLWIEDTSFQRLARNNFLPGTGITIQPRLGPGFTVTPTLLASQHVSARGAKAVLSYESKSLKSLLPVPEVRVRVHVGLICVVPMVRWTTISTPVSEVWTINGTTLSTSRGNLSLATSEPLSRGRIAQAGVPAPSRIILQPSESGIVYATEAIGTFLPGEVFIPATKFPNLNDELLATVAAQFLSAIGYSEDEGEGGEGRTFRR